LPPSPLAFLHSRPGTLPELYNILAQDGAGGSRVEVPSAASNDNMEGSHATIGRLQGN